MFADLITLAADQKHDLPAPPFVFGLVAFAFLVVLMVALLMFGKGRPHS